MSAIRQNDAFFCVLQDPIKILFVDDDPILREFAVVHLSSENTSVDVLDDGVSALEQLDSVNPDIILLDLEMPRMDGFEFLQHLRSNPRHSGIPVIVCTGREDVKAIDRAFEAGATSFVVKPINWRLLTYQIRFVDRAGKSEPVQSGLEDLARAGSRFMTHALRARPDLRTEAEPFARALEAHLTPMVASA
ncbi:hypothetical protein BH11PSE2_BH11PSE2_13570 [soil metagenome]